MISATTTSKITTNEDTKKEANRQNVFCLVYIGVKRAYPGRSWTGQAATPQTRS